MRNVGIKFQNNMALDLHLTKPSGHFVTAQPEKIGPCSLLNIRGLKIFEYYIVCKHIISLYQFILSQL